MMGPDHNGPFLMTAGDILRHRVLVLCDLPSVFHRGQCVLGRGIANMPGESLTGIWYCDLIPISLIAFIIVTVIIAVDRWDSK
jgi:hypothetical protein